VRYVLEKDLPELSELDRGPWRLHEARQFVDALQRKLFTLGAAEPAPGGPASDEVAALGRRLGIAAIAAKIYPEARRALVAKGRPGADVDAMPVVQVALLYSFDECERVGDESYKWLNVP
jgi:hypothetical protein